MDPECLRPEPEVVHKFTQLVPPDGNWRDRLLAYLRAERDLGRLAPAAPVEAAATMIVGVCHELVLTLLLPGTADSGITREPPDVSAVVSVILNGILRIDRVPADATNNQTHNPLPRTDRCSHPIPTLPPPAYRRPLRVPIRAPSASTR